jgi:ribosomal protein L37AE/L43A
MMILVVGVGLAAVTALSGVLVVARRTRRREVAAAADAATHPHYCAECDQEWVHAGKTCLYPWASVCQKCAQATARTGVAAFGSQA